MTSPPALLYDTVYHIYNRGTNRENIFIEERNYVHFLNLWGRHIDPVAETFAYCLLRNHFHALVRTRSKEEITESLKGSHANQPARLQDPLASQEEGSRKKPLGSVPSQKFSDFFNAYAKSINKAYGRTGSLFQHPFGRIPVTSDRQFWNVIAYIHQNPQKHGFAADFRDWKYSSYGILLAETPTYLKREEVLAWFGDRESYQRLHQTWVTDTQARWFAEEDED